ADEEKVLNIIREELTEIKDKYGDERRTEIAMGGIDFFEDEDLIPEENSIITLTHEGHIKRLPLSTYRTQNRGDRGVQGMGSHRDDFVDHSVSTTIDETTVLFTNKGKGYRLAGYEIPEFDRTAKGLPRINVLQIEKDEWINPIISVREFEADH